MAKATGKSKPKSAGRMTARRMKNEFEGHGEQLMEAGSCWLQAPKIEHTVLDYSDDCEVLEIIVPADFKTVELIK